MAKALYYENFEVGQVITSEGYTIDRDHAIAFAREYDPQAQHIDAEGAKKSVFGGLVVSGWQTAAISMRLKMTSAFAQTEEGIVGMGLDHVRWPRPVYPGDTLHIAITILEMRLSASRPNSGIVKYKLETFNQKNELVMEMTTSVLMPRKPAA